MTIPSIYDVAQDVNTVVGRLRVLEAAHKKVTNDLRVRIKALEVRNATLEAWLQKDNGMYETLDDEFVYGSLTDFVVQAAHDGLYVSHSIDARASLALDR